MIQASEMEVDSLRKRTQGPRLVRRVDAPAGWPHSKVFKTANSCVACVRIAFVPNRPEFEPLRVKASLVSRASLNSVAKSIYIKHEVLLSQQGPKQGTAKGG